MLHTTYWHSVIMVSRYQYCRFLSNQQDKCNMVSSETDLLTDIMLKEKRTVFLGIQPEQYLLLLACYFPSSFPIMETETCPSTSSRHTFDDPFPSAFNLA